MEPANRKNFYGLAALAPVDAIRVCLNGSFGMSDVSTLISAIRKDRRIALSDDELLDLIVEALEDGLDAPACLERLVAPRSAPPATLLSAARKAAR